MFKYTWPFVILWWLALYCGECTSVQDRAIFVTLPHPYYMFGNIFFLGTLFGYFVALAFCISKR